MKAEFLRHEYTWSKQSIGGTIGLGVTSSGTPKEKVQLREMEKMAGMAEPDSETGLEVELLMYSVEAGFVKLVVKPVPAGEDQRKNKKVYLYQCADRSITDPAVYCIPRGSWEHTEEIYLPPVSLSEEWDNYRDILNEYGLSDRLPDLFRAVFWCVFRGGSNLAFVVPWKREEYAALSRKLMYAIHSLLPEDLRKNAGYASLGCGMNSCSSFYFTDTPPESDYYDLSSMDYSGRNRQGDCLDVFFYRTLADIFLKREGLYLQFVEEMQEMIRGREINKNMLREVQWLFLQLCLQNMIDIPGHNDVMDLFPQLFYRAGDTGILSEIRNNLMEYYHVENWENEEYERYVDTLMHGMTKKGEEQIITEMDWALSRLHKDNPGMVEDYLDNLRESRKTTYTRLMTRAIDDGTSISHEYYNAHLGSLSEIEGYVDSMDPAAITEEAKEAWMLRGIEILNEDVFSVDRFRQLTRIADHFRWREAWLEVLQGFLKQLKDRCTELTDHQLDAACEIEDLYESLTEIREDTALKQEKERRQEEIRRMEQQMKLQAEKEEKEDDGEGGSLPVTAEEKDPENEIYRSLEDDEEGDREKHLSFLIRGIPYGFLTACILYLLRYSLLIGHWKISIGAGGMWLILMLNYVSERIEKKKKDGYRLWQALGLCLIEGYIIKTIAWMILPQNLRIYFFLVMGAVTMVIQFIHAVLLLKKREEEL